MCNDIWHMSCQFEHTCYDGMQVKFIFYLNFLNVSLEIIMGAYDAYSLSNNNNNNKYFPSLELFSCPCVSFFFSFQLEY